jgi:hypothetical protein
MPSNHVVMQLAGKLLFKETHCYLGEGARGQSRPGILIMNLLALVSDYKQVVMLTTSVILFCPKTPNSIQGMPRLQTGEATMSVVSKQINISLKYADIAVAQQYQHIGAEMLTSGIVSRVL